MYYKRIRELREDNDELQKDIAKLLNTTQQHYSKIENGGTEITADRIIKLARHYKVSADYIFGAFRRKKTRKRQAALSTRIALLFHDRGQGMIQHLCAQKHSRLFHNRIPLSEDLALLFLAETV